MVQDQGDFYDQKLKKADDLRDAQIFRANTQRPFRIQSFVIPLDVAQTKLQPYAIKLPFLSICAVSATDSATTLNLRIGSIDSIQSSIPIKQNFQLNLNAETSECYLDWLAQPGKSMTLLFFVDAQLNTGSQLISISGGVTQQDGTAVNGIASVNLAAATAAVIAPALSTRKTCMLVNNTASTIYLGGDATVTADATATGGIPIVAGGTFVWRNPAALYAISTPGGLVNRLEEL